MKISDSILVAAAVTAISCTPAWAQQATAKASVVIETQSSLLGSWSLDVSRMAAPPSARPKSVIITFADIGTAGADKWSTKVTITGGDGTVREMTSRYARGGKAVPIEGDQMEADIAAVATPTPNVMVLALGKNDQPASTRIYTVSADGRAMTEQAVSYDGEGKPVIRTHYFSRIS